MKIFNNVRNYIDDNSFIITLYKDKVDIINYNDIVSIKDDSIIINCDKRITIEGKNLKVNKLFSDEIVIHGRINSLNIYE